MKVLNAKVGRSLARDLGLDISDDVKTYYAATDNMTELFCFESRKERDDFVACCSDGDFDED